MKAWRVRLMYMEPELAFITWGHTRHHIKRLHRIAARKAGLVVPHSNTIEAKREPSYDNHPEAMVGLMRDETELRGEDAA